MHILANHIIKLRALEPEDIDFLFDTENDSAFWEISGTQTPFSRHILERYITNAHQDIYEAKQLRLVIEDATNNKTIIGMIDLFDFDPQHQRAGVGILILKAYQQKGLATEALNIFINYAFEILRLHQVYANITEDNQRSISLFEKLHFEKIGTKKDWIKTENTFKNVLLYQLINTNS